jgi:hypothetical protein
MEEEQHDYVLLQPPSPFGRSSEPGDRGTGLDVSFDPSEFCCFCRLCLDRNDSIAESIVRGITEQWASRPATWSSSSYKNDQFTL